MVVSVMLITGCDGPGTMNVGGPADARVSADAQVADRGPAADAAILDAISVNPFADTGPAPTPDAATSDARLDAAAFNDSGVPHDAVTPPPPGDAAVDAQMDTLVDVAAFADTQSVADIWAPPMSDARPSPDIARPPDARADRPQPDAALDGPLLPAHDAAPDLAPSPVPDAAPLPVPDVAPLPEIDAASLPAPDTAPLPVPDTSPLPVPDAALDARPLPAPDATPDAAPPPVPDAAPPPVPDASPPDVPWPPPPDVEPDLGPDVWVDAAPPPEPDAGPDPNDPALDSDEDGISNLDEVRLGTDPFDVDSDSDALTDGEETGPDLNAPFDSDLDGLINALENRKADNDVDGTLDAFDVTSGWQMSYGRFRPFAIRTDRQDSARIEVRIVGGRNIRQVVVAKSVEPASPYGTWPNVGLFIDNVDEPNVDVELYDDGTRGDRVAGDGIYSREGFTAVTRTERAFDQIDIHRFDSLTVTDNGGTITRNVWDSSPSGTRVLGPHAFVLGVIAPDAVQQPEWIAPNVQATSHLINIIDPVAMTRLKRYLYTGSARTIQPLTRIFYETFDDDYDFLWFFPESPVIAGAHGFSTLVNNDTEGIGRAQFLQAPLYGSAERLQHVAALNFADNGPILHETLHRWAVYLDDAFGFMDLHWGNVGADGQLGGFDPATLVDNGNGTYAVGRYGLNGNGGDSVPYSAIELYLMGLLGPHHVPAIPVLRNPSRLGSDGVNVVYSASGVDNVTIDDIIARHGPRIPVAGESQSDFRGAFVIVSQRRLTAAEMSFFNVQAQLFGAPEGDGRAFSFAEATGGRATMDTRIRR